MGFQARIFVWKYLLPIERKTCYYLFKLIDSMINKLMQAIEWRIMLPFTLFKWYTSDRKGIAPHYVKQLMINQYRKKHHCDVLLETGTFMGEMVNAMKNKFSQIHSIELNPQFAANARARFKKYSHIKIWEGDSAERIQDVLQELRGNTIFWLDGHCCIHDGQNTSRGEEDSPIMSEMNYIVQHMKKYNLKHVILIDDARLFVGTDGYPEVPYFKEFVKKEMPESHIEIKNDSIIIY